MTLPICLCILRRQYVFLHFCSDDEWPRGSQLHSSACTDFKNTVIAHNFNRRGYDRNLSCTLISQSCGSCVNDTLQLWNVGSRRTPIRTTQKSNNSNICSDVFLAKTGRKLAEIRFMQNKKELFCFLLFQESMGPFWAILKHSVAPLHAG